MKLEPISAFAQIENDETLYRAVRNDPRFFPEDGKGGRRISSMAFNDSKRRPSVDRALFCPAGAVETRSRFAEGSGALALFAGEVRGLSAVHGATGAIYGVDAEAVPLPENSAHAEIFGRPPFDTEKLFERIKHSLSRIAVISLHPENLFDS